ncbi:MAG: squalene/phytoene synthase family protein [Bacillota bacterium]
MSDNAIKFCEDILKKVSRSFALTIPMLDDDIYKEVMITYLQDRLLDNFEDELNDISLEKRKYLMDEVVKIFAPEKSNEEAVQIIEAKASLFKKESLKKLTANASLVQQAYKSLDRDIREISFKWLKEMNEGMQIYLDKKVEKFSELDEYCYYVAGTVGGFLTDLIIYKSEIDDESQEILKSNFKDAGLFLQKVNLIRDIKKDIESRDKNYWPLKELGINEDMILDKKYKNEMKIALKAMLNDVKEHVKPLVDYMEHIPAEFSGYKKFFAVNNALGLATLEAVENNLDKLLYADKKVKASKLEFFKITTFPKRTFHKKAEKFI